MSTRLSLWMDQWSSRSEQGCIHSHCAELGIEYLSQQMRIGIAFSQSDMEVSQNILAKLSEMMCIAGSYDNV